MYMKFYNIVDRCLLLKTILTFDRGEKAPGTPKAFFVLI